MAVFVKSVAKIPSKRIPSKICFYRNWEQSFSWDVDIPAHFKNIYLRKNQKMKRSSGQIDWASCPRAVRAAPVGEGGTGNRITRAIYPLQFSVVRDSLALRGFQCMHRSMTFWTWESRTAQPLGNVSLALTVHGIHRNFPESPQNSKMQNAVAQVSPHDAFPSPSIRKLTKWCKGLLNMWATLNSSLRIFQV